MTNIDTIREALELALEYVGTEGGMMTRQEAKLQIALKQALAALSTIEADSRPQEPSKAREDAIRRETQVKAIDDGWAWIGRNIGNHLLIGDSFADAILGKEAEK